MWCDLLKKERLPCFVCGAVVGALGVKALKSKTLRKLCVKGLAKGMKFQNDAQEALQNMKEDAADICYDAKHQATSQGEATPNNSEAL